MSERVALLLESQSRNTYAVICNSRAAADVIRKASPDECVGIVPVLSRVDALLPTEQEQ